MEKLNEAYPVEFRIWQENHYSVVLKTKDVSEPKIVVLIYKPLLQEKIAHELLHMFCQLTLGTNECMLSTPEDDILIRKIFTEDFCEQLLNNAEHIIMFSEYKDLGYDLQLFFEPFEDPGSKIALFKSYGIRNHGRKYSLSMVVNYLALCIHLNSFPIDNSCQKYLKEIRNIEYPLYYADQLKKLSTSKAIITEWMIFIIVFVLLTELDEKCVDYYSDKSIMIKAIGLTTSNAISKVYDFLGVVALYGTSIHYTNKHQLSSTVIELGAYCLGVYLFQQFILQALYYHTQLPTMVGTDMLPWIGFAITLIISLSSSYLVRLTKIGRKLI